jgi:hypothetical protein
MNKEQIEKYRYGCPMRDGDVMSMEQCDDPDCADNRPGMNHAHLIRVVDRNGVEVDPTVPR